jgi:N-acetylmuramoyl-L-alanine amidase
VRGKLKIFKALMFLFITFLIFKADVVFASSSNKYTELTPKLGVSSNKVWTINFNLPVKPETVNNKNIVVVDSSSKQVPVKVSLGVDKKSVVVSPPSEGYKPGQAYYLQIGSGILSSSGKSLQSEVKMKFTINEDNLKLTSEEIQKKSQALVTIKSYDGEGKLLNTGKGFITSADGQVVTNYSSIEGAYFAEIITYDNKTYTVNGVSGYDTLSNIAVLKVNGANFSNFINIGDSNKISIGEEIAAIVNTYGIQKNVINSRIGGILESNVDKQIIITDTVSENYVGGVIINLKGEAVGVISGGFSDGQITDTFIVPINKVKSLGNSTYIKTLKEVMDEKNTSSGNSGNGVYKVVLDPGHGGADRYNKGPTGYVEADGTLDISLKTREILKQYPQIQVFMTRESDITLNADSRVAKANSFGADILVSVHTNAGPPSARGAETFYSIKSQQGVGGHKLANLVLNHIVNYTGISSRGAKTKTSTTNPNMDYYYMIRETKPISIIVEAAFHTNPEEERLLKTEEFRYKVALGIARGIVEYFGLKWKEPAPLR